MSSINILPLVPASGPREDDVRRLRNTLDDLTNIRIRILFDHARSIADRQAVADLVVEAAQEAFDQLVVQS